MSYEVDGEQYIAIEARLGRVRPADLCPRACP